MQPDPLSKSSGQSPQPFTSSSAGPMQSAPIPSPTSGLAPTQAPPAGMPVGAYGTPKPTDHLASLVKTHSSGANWFFWIVGLSIVNALLISFGSDRVMAIGTNATMFMDYMAKDLIAKGTSAGGMRVMELVFDVLVLGFYAFCGLMALRGKAWAFYLGMTFFALDALISIPAADIIGGLIHLWALFSMWQGVKALKEIHALNKAAAQPASPWATS